MYIPLRDTPAGKLPVPIQKGIITLIKSMTGYGRAVETVNGREFTVELRSVNNRYLDCTVKLPRSVSFAEDVVKQAVKQAVSRGKVDVFISIKSESAEDTTVTLNKAVLEGYLTAMRQMVAQFGVQDDISVSTVSRLPEVFTMEKPEVDEEQLLADLMSVVSKALESYNAMRCTEGVALDADLRSRSNTILELVAQVEQGNAQTVIDYRTRLENKLREILENTNIDAAGAERLSGAAIECWNAINAKDVDAWGKATTESFMAQIAMFPNMMAEHVVKAINEYKDSVKGYKITGAGGGGYLVIINDTPVKNALQIRIRRK